MLIELVGYIGSILVVVSMLMSSVLKLRIINTVGGAIFSVYALIIQSYPTAIMNIILCGINIYYLAKLRNPERNFDLVELVPQDPFVKYMLQRYGKDISECFPGFEPGAAPADRACIVCCDGAPAGLFLAKQSGDSLDIALDYSTPTYRDCSVGRYLYGKLASGGVRELRYAMQPGRHEDYLRSMGFEQKDGAFVKTL